MLLAALAGCGSATDARRPEVRTAELLEAGPLARRLEVELARPDSLVVDYWTDGGPRLRVRSPRAASHSLLLARLRAGRSYRWEVAGTSHAGTFDTAPLPADLAQVAFAATGTPTVPLVLVHLSRAGGFMGYAVVDAAGEVVWFWRGTGFPYGRARRQNGDFVFMDGARGLVEVDPAGAEVRVLPQDTVSREMHHDVIATPANTLLFIAFDNRVVNGARLKGEAIWEWSPEAGTAVKRWSAWDHFSPDHDRGPRFGVEWMHANSLSLGPRQNVLMSIHYFNQVISIAPGWGAVEWRLGGVNATLPLPPEERFTGQHTAREIATGRIVLFDNRAEQGGYSRAVELDIGGAVPQRVWEWRPERPNFTAAVSSARRLANGNTLVAFGMSAGLAGSTGPTEAYEVAPDGQTLWYLSVDGVSVMFRAEPLDAIAGEAEVDGPG